LILYFPVAADVFSKYKVLAQQNGVKAIMNFGTADGYAGIHGTVLSRVADNSTLRKALADKLVLLVEKYKFDGINLKWHFPCCPKVKINLRL